MKRVLIAALLAVFAATALPGAAAAQERDSVLLPLAGGLGTANWIVNWPWKDGKTFKVKVNKFAKFSKTVGVKKVHSYKHSYKHGYKGGFKYGHKGGFKYGYKGGFKYGYKGGFKYGHKGGFKHHKKFKTVHKSSNAGIKFVHGAIFCSALSPIITVAIEKRELSNQEVIDSTIGCFFPPWAFIKLFSN